MLAIRFLAAGDGSSIRRGFREQRQAVGTTASTTKEPRLVERSPLVSIWVHPVDLRLVSLSDHDGFTIRSFATKKSRGRVHDAMEEAVEWVRRCPDPMPGEEAEIEIRPVLEAEDFGNELTPELREQEARVRAELERQRSS